MNPQSLIVLFIIACTSVISALPPHGHVDRVLGAPNMASNGLSNVRNLKQDVTNGQFTELEDRTVDQSALQKLVINLRYRLVKLFRNMQLSWSRETPEAAFKSLYLHAKQEKLFGSPSFAAWVSFTRKKYPDSAGDEILRVLFDHHYTPDFLAPLLVQAVRIPGQRKVAAGIYHDLLSFWTQQEKTSGQVFHSLKLEEIGDVNTGYKEGLLIWFGYVQKQNPDNWSDVCKKQLASLPYFGTLSQEDREQQASNLVASLLGKFNQLQFS